MTISQRLRVPLPPTDTKLAILRNALAEVTALPPSSFKLVHAGAVMKDDNVPSEAFMRSCGPNDVGLTASCSFLVRYPCR